MLYDKRWETKRAEQELVAPQEPWRQILLEAADIIERDGWCRWHYHRNGAHCAIGAISAAARVWPAKVLGNPKSDCYKASRRMKAALGGQGVGQWNDHPDRTAAEVVAKMREVARS